MSSLFERIGRLAAARWPLLLAAYALLSLVLLWTGKGIPLETALTELLPRGTPSADDFRSLLSSRGTLDSLLVSISLGPEAGARADGDDRSADALAEAAEAFGTELEAEGLVTAVRWGVDADEAERLAGFAMAHLPVLADPSRRDDLAARLEPERIRSAIEAIRLRSALPGIGAALGSLAAVDPLGLLAALPREEASGPGGILPDPATGLLLSRDGRSVLVVAEPTHPPTEIDFSRRLFESVRRAEARTREAISGGDALRFEFAGGHLFALEDERRIRHDAAATSAFSLIGVAAVYLLVVRRAALWATIVVPMVLSTLWTLGLAAIYPGRLNMITVAFAAILLGIGDDGMMLLYFRLREEMGRGAKAAVALPAALAAAGPGVATAMLTTAAAFLSLSWVRFRGLSELGIIAAVGMLSLLAGVLVFFPAALMWNARREETRPAPPVRLPVAALAAIHGALWRRRRLALGTAAVATLVMLAAIPSLRVSRDLRSIRGEDPAAAQMERVLAPFGAGGATETLFVVHGGGGETDPADREALLEEEERTAAACSRLRAEGAVLGCSSMAAFRPSDRTQRRRFAATGDLPWAEAAATIEEEAARQGLDPAFFAPFTRAARAYGRFDAVRIDLAGSARGVTRVEIASSADAPVVASRLRDEVGEPKLRIASIALVASDLGRILEEDFRRAAWIVAAAVLVLLATALRRARAVLLAMLPVSLGLAWLLGTLALAGAEVNLMTLMALPIVLGLGVDFGVYLTDRWAEGREGPAEIVRILGPVVLVTGLTTVAGFAALLAAELQGLRTLGTAVVLGTGYTLLAALFVLPLLLPARPPRAA